MKLRTVGIPVLVALCTLFLPNAALAQNAAMNVTKSGQIDEDVYTAGATVQMLANVDGDVVAAGGSITVAESVSGDVLSAGGTVTVSATVGDDLRLAGGSVSIGGKVAGDAVIAGGSVTLGSSSAVGGRAWLAGGEVLVDGPVAGELKAAGGKVIVSSTIDGDAEIYAESVIVESDAVITGNLTYMSPNEAVIREGARIDGVVNWRQFDFEHEFVHERWDIGASILFFLSFAVSSIVLCLVYPRFAASVVGCARGSIFKSLGLGVLVLLLAPFVVLMLMASMVGIPLGLIVLALYFVALLVGFLVTLAWVGDQLFRLFGKDPDESRLTRSASILVAGALLLAVGFIPVVGGLVLFVGWLIGMGAMKLHLYRAYAGLRGG